MSGGPRRAQRSLSPAPRSAPPSVVVRVEDPRDAEAPLALLLRGAESKDALASLTAAEREVALLAARGVSSAEIARQRGAAVRTVCNQLARIFRKLRVRSRGELARAVALR